MPPARLEPVVATAAATPAATPAAIFCRELSVRFQPGQDVLQRINLHIPAGEIVSLIGPSGCGKTTLLRTLAGLQAASAGRVEVQPPAQPDRGELAFVFQQPTLLPWRSARENVMLALQLCDRAMSAGEARQRAERELAAMELPPAAFTRFPRELSGGMRMRVSLARALVTQPTVLLLDEPFAALDDLLRSALGELLLRRWQQRPFTAVWVTHNIAEAALLSHRIAVMHAGRITAEVIDELPRPRDEQVRTSPEFSALYRRISAALRQEEPLRPDAALRPDQAVGP